MDRVPRSGEALMAGTFAAALTAGTVILSLVLLIVAGATFMLGYLTSLGDDGPGTASFPGMTTWLIVVAVTGAIYCVALWAMLRALHLDRPTVVAVLTTVGLCVAVVVWWKLGPGAEHHRFGMMSALFLLPPVTFVISSLATLATGRRTARPELALTRR